MTNKVAIIDCGTNTFHLLIADYGEGRFHIKESLKLPVKIGAGGINNGRLTEEAKKRAMNALTSFKSIIDRLNITHVTGLATSAFRSTSNAKGFAIQIEDQLGIKLDIIDGNREAELIYKGASLALNYPTERILVMDIGGGSVEFIIGEGGSLLWKQSYEIGGQRLLDKFSPSDPITSKEIEVLNNYINSEVQSLYEALDKYTPAILVGASGTFDTLSEMHCAQQGIAIEDDPSELPLNFEAYHQLHQLLVKNTRSERFEIPGMIAMRVDMIVVASCLIDSIIKKYKFEGIRVSTYAMKEGFLSELINTEIHGENN